MQAVKKAKATRRTIVEQGSGKSVTTDMIGVVILLVMSITSAMVDWKEMLTFPTTSSNARFEHTSHPPSLTKKNGHADARVAQELCNSTQFGPKFQPIHIRTERMANKVQHPMKFDQTRRS